MKTSIFAKTFILAAIGALISTASSSGALVTWDFNPSNLDAPVGSPTHVFTSSGFSVTATGYDNEAGPDPFHQLYYKFEPPVNGASERGLGMVNTDSNELNVNPDGSVAQYIQLDLRSILAQGFTNGQVSMGSVQNGEGFRLFGSNTAGVLGTQLPGTYSGVSFDNKFVSVPNFGSFQFLSVAALTGRVLLVEFQATMTPVPEMNALFPIIGLLTAVSSTHILRRRRAARVNAAS